VQLRRQLQTLVPELTVTLPPQAPPRVGGAAQPPPGRPEPPAGGGAPEELLARVAELRAAAAAVLDERAGEARCAGVSAALGAWLATQAPPPTSCSRALAPVKQEQRVEGGRRPARKQRGGPSAAAAARLARLRQLQADGAELAAQLA
jgi:hypothetical protein